LIALVSLVLAAVIALAVGLATGGPAHTRTAAGAGGGSQAINGVPAARQPGPGGARPGRSGATVPPAAGPYPVGLRTMRLVDSRRRIHLADGTSEPRVLVTYVRYPARGPAGSIDLPNAPAAQSSGPFPVIVFGHGFAVTPALYSRLLQAWARAGYVVAAPVFPLENADAPGGPDEGDLVNQPADISFVISRMLAQTRAAGSPLGRVIDPRRVAVAGQSDGGNTALTVAYDPPFRDARVGAAVILSGGEIPALGAFRFPKGGPPLLATQGTADTINPPSFTYAFFGQATRPKYLLSLLGATHLPPYSHQQPQLSIVEHVTTAFLDHYLKRTVTLGHMEVKANVPGIASLRAEP
jgi:dienelactone hydrolase